MGRRKRDEPFENRLDTVLTPSARKHFANRLDSLLTGQRRCGARGWRSFSRTGKQKPKIHFRFAFITQNNARKLLQALFATRNTYLISIWGLLSLALFQLKSALSVKLQVFTVVDISGAAVDTTFSKEDIPEFRPT